MFQERLDIGTNQGKDTEEGTTPERLALTTHFAVEDTISGVITGPKFVAGRTELMLKPGFFSSLNFHKVFSASVLLAAYTVQ
jgi:hypothetical protein